MGDNELKHVQRAFETNWIAPAGPDIKKFEESIRQYFNVEAAVALSSGTAALHLALICAGVKKDDEVLVQSLTFTASANPVVYLGAKPIFIDSERETWNLDPDVLREAIIDRINKGKKPKAIVAVHLFGMPAKMTELEEVAREFGIFLIEDAAEAAGSHHRSKMCGSFGDISVVSFNGNKIITTSGGGALLSNSKSLIDRALHLSTQAKDDAPHFLHSEIGYNYRLSNVSACIGVGQMEVLPNRVLQRRNNFNYYKRHLADMEGIEFLEEPEGFYSNRWLTTILVDPELTGGVSREDIRLQLAANDIEARPVWKPLHTQPVYEGQPYYGGNVAEYLFDHGLCLPSGTNMDEEDLERVVFDVKKAITAKSGSRSVRVV